MRRSLTSNDLATLRTRPQKTDLRLVIHKPASVLQATLNSIPVYPSSALAITVTGGNTTDVLSGMTLINGGAVVGASDKGKIRVRHDMSSSSVIHIAEFGSGLINWATGDKLTVLREFRPWTKFPHYDNSASQWTMDWSENYSDQYSGKQRPIVIMGPPAVGIKGGDNIKLVGTSSIFYNSATLTTASWFCSDGGSIISPAGGGSVLGTENDPVIASFESGRQDGAYVSLKIIDSNGSSAIGHRLVFEIDPTLNASKVNIGQIVGGIKNGGYIANISVFGNGNADLTDFPNEAEIVVYEYNTKYGSNSASIGNNYPYRENIVFRGWIVSDTQRINPYTGTVNFVAGTIDSIMKQAESFDVFLAQASAAPTGASRWVEVCGLSLDLVAHNLVKYRSTVDLITDVWFAGGTASRTDTLLYQDLPRTSWFDQIKSNYGDKGFLGYVASDLQSSLFCFADAQITGTSAVLPSNILDNEDVIADLIVESKHQDTVSEVLLMSVASDTGYGAISPRGAPGYFGVHQEQTKGLAIDQNDLITWSGNFRAKNNSSYPRNTIPLAGNYKIDSVPQSILSLSLSAASNPRGLTWNNKGFYPYTTQIDYDSRTGFIKVQLEAEEIVNGIGGGSFAFPTPDITPTTSPPSPPSPPEPPGGTGQGDGFGTVFVQTGKIVGRTNDFSASSPSWSSIGPTMDTGKWMRHFILDPWSPLTTGFLATDMGVYKCTNLRGASPSWSLVLSAATIEATTGATFGGPMKLVGSINTQYFIGLFFKVGKKGWFAKTTNGGDSWSIIQIVDHSAYTSFHFATSADIVPYAINNNLRLYMLCATQNGFPVIGQDEIYRSDDAGATWTLKKAYDPGAGNVYPSTMLICPYNDNSDGNNVIAYLTHTAGEGVFESTNGGVSFSEINSDNFSQNITCPNPINVYTQNANVIHFVTNDFTGSVFLRCYRTTNGGNTWNTIFDYNTSGGATTVGWRAFGGFPYVQDQLYAVISTDNSGEIPDSTYQGIFVSTDGGATWTDKTGNWSFDFDFATFDYGQGGTIVPIWVAE